MSKKLSPGERLIWAVGLALSKLKGANVDAAIEKATAIVLELRTVDPAEWPWDELSPDAAAMLRDMLTDDCDCSGGVTHIVKDHDGIEAVTHDRCTKCGGTGKYYKGGEAVGDLPTQCSCCSSIGKAYCDCVCHDPHPANDDDGGY